MTRTENYVCFDTENSSLLGCVTGQEIPYIFKGIIIFEMSTNTGPTTQCHILEGLTI
jgi:hypothetical protein